MAIPGWSTKRIRHDTLGRPYVLTPSGRVRYISRKSARLARERRGGMY